MIPAAEDYPAAHSMDTTWFAVDRDGYVAKFDSGEAGAMPEEAADDSKVWGPATDGPWYRAVVFEPTPNEGGDLGHHAHLYSKDTELIMFLESAQAIEAVRKSGQVEPVASKEGHGVIWRGISQATWTELHDRGLCRQCRHWYNPHAELDEEEEEATSGPSGAWAYQYTHLTENWISGPYVRETSPVRPLHVDELDPEVRDAVKAVRFDLSFAESEKIQPLELLPCVSWSAAWLSLDRVVRPVPGMEEEYWDEIEELEDLRESGYRIEMPAGEPPPKRPAHRPPAPAASPKVPWWKRLFGG